MISIILTKCISVLLGVNCTSVKVTAAILRTYDHVCTLMLVAKTVTNVDSRGNDTLSGGATQHYFISLLIKVYCKAKTKNLLPLGT